MKQYSFATLMAFATRADTREKISQAKKVLYRQKELEPWQLDDLFGELQNRKRYIEREEA